MRTLVVAAVIAASLAAAPAADARPIINQSKTDQCTNVWGMQTPALIESGYWQPNFSTLYPKDCLPGWRQTIGGK